MEDQYVIKLAVCNRCGEKSYESLGSHSYCVNCNYSPALDECAEQCVQIPDWAIQVLRHEFNSNKGKKSERASKALGAA
jgi:hypothetical protein